MREHQEGHQAESGPGQQKPAPRAHTQQHLGQHPLSGGSEPNSFPDPPSPHAPVPPWPEHPHGEAGAEGRDAEGRGKGAGGCEGEQQEEGREGLGSPSPPRPLALRSPPGRSLALVGVEVGSSWKEAASTSSSSRSVRLYTSSRSMSSCLKSLVSTPGRGTRIPPRLGRASCCQWWRVTEPGNEGGGTHTKQRGSAKPRGTSKAAWGHREAPP